MSRTRSRFERLRRAAADALGCPECRPQVIEIVEVVVDSHEAVAGELDCEAGPAPPAYCVRCGRPLPVRFIEVAVVRDAGKEPEED